jgi:lipopolysaccharide export system protein LptA
MNILRAAFLSVLVSPAAAQGLDGTLGLNGDQPIAVNADSFSADLEAETGTYTGNVLVVQGAVKLHADEITIAAPRGKATRMEAQGHVVLDTPSGTAVGNTAVYDIPRQVVRLAGNVALTRDRNVMRGSSLEVDVATGRAKLAGTVATGGQGQDRVQGLFVPQGAQ